MDNYVLSIKDLAGNECSINVTILKHVHNIVNNVCTICGEGLAPANELEKWDYTLDEVNKKVRLNNYIGADENVAVYSNYDIDGECYKTKLKSNDNDSYNYMFKNNTIVRSITFQKEIDTNVNNMYKMFHNCSSLTSLDVSNFDTSDVTYMGNMFSGCSSLTSLNVSNFDTSNVTNMSVMFDRCSSLTSLDISNFDTSNVANMSSMFYECSNLTSLDLSNFDTSKVTMMYGMFKYCSKLTVIYVNKDIWKTEQAKTNNMFDNCGVSEVTYKDAV